MALADLNVRLGLATQNFEKSLKDVDSKLRRFQRNIEGIGKNLTTSLTLPLVGVGAAATKVFADFELSIAKVQAVSGATGKAFEELRANALELGRTTQFTATEVANLQLNLSKLGFSPTEINQSTAAILDLALATGEDLAQSASVAASTLRGFGLDATETIRVTNVMADSFSSTALDLAKFQTSIAIVAPVARQAGASLEETTAVLGTLINRGVDASSAGSALRNIFLDLADKGFTWEEAMVKVRDSVNPLATAMELFGKRGATVATIIANNRDEISGLTADFQDAQGEARNMAAIMENTLSGTLNRLKSAVEGAGISMGELLAPAIGRIADTINSAVTTFNGFNDETKKSIIRIGALVAAIGPTLFAIGKLVGLTRSMIGTAKLLGTAFASLGGSAITAAANIQKLNVAALLTPQMIALTAAVSVGIAVWSAFGEKVRLANAAQNAVKDVTEQAAKALAVEEVKVGRLVDVLKDENATREEKKRALDQLQEASPEYFANIDLEKSKIEDITAAYEDWRKSVLLQATAQAALNKLTENASRRIEKLQEEENLRASIAEQTGGKLKAAFSIASGSITRTAAQLNRVKNELTSIDQENEALLKTLKDAEAAGGIAPPQITGTNPTAGLDATGISGGSDLQQTLGSAALKKAQAEARILKETLASVGDEFLAIDEKAKIFGSTFDADAAKVDVLGASINKLLESGGTVDSPGIQSLITQIDELRGTVSEVQQLPTLNLIPEELVSTQVAGLEQIKGTTEALGLTTQEAFAKYGTGISASVEAMQVLLSNTQQLGLLLNENKQAVINFGDVGATAINSFGSGLVSAIEGTKQFGKAVLQTISDVIKVLVQQGIAAIIANTLKVSGSVLGPLAIPVAAAAGAAASALFNKVVGLADGGIVPPGFPNDTFPARLSSGEAVIPLDRLSSITGGNQTQVFIPELVLRGEDLVIAFNKAQNNFNRFS